MGWKYFRASVFIGSFLTLFVAFSIVGILFLAKWIGPPSITVPETTVFYDSTNKPFGELSVGGQRYWVGLDKISPTLIQATIATEDKDFYRHHGFDFKRLVGAIVADIKARAKVQGASTVTQQYAKNLYLNQEKTFMRKLTEAWYAIRLETNYTKDDILEGYLNTIYYGHGIYGIEGAAQFYFGKSAEHLNLAEATMLAAIPKGPTYYSPYNNKENALARQRLILTTMANQKIISKNTLDATLNQPLHLKPFQQNQGNKIAPYFQDQVKKELAEKAHISKEVIEKGGLRVYTTLDTTMQQKAEQQIATISPTSQIEVALVAINQKTGEVKALVGGRDYEQSPFNRATQALRQTGSTFKPFLYYTALENGFTPTTQLKSEYTSFSYGGNEFYTPKNYHSYYANDFISLAQALALSDNIYAVKTHLFLGTDSLLNTAKKFGITAKLDKVPSLALGVSPVKPMEMVTAYGMIANGGQKIAPIFVKRVVDGEGNILYDAKISHEQVLNRDKLFVLTDMMRGMFDPTLSSYTNVTGQSIANILTRHYAGKSGSTKTDSWMIGFSPQLVTGVWVGYDKGKVIEEKQEQQYSKIIWANFMESALKDMPVKNFQPPENVVAVSVDMATGKLAVGSKGRKMYFVKGTEPRENVKVTKKGTGKKGWKDWFPFFSG